MKALKAIPMVEALENTGYIVDVTRDVDDQKELQWYYTEIVSASS